MYQRHSWRWNSGAKMSREKGPVAGARQTVTGRAVARHASEGEWRMSTRLPAVAVNPNSAQ
jgi:hypothetical protein